MFVKHAENCLIENFEAYQGMNSMVNKLPDNVFVIGSHIQKECTKQKVQNNVDFSVFYIF